MLNKIKHMTIYQIVITLLIVGFLVFTVFNLSSHLLLRKSFFELIDSVVYYGQSMFSKEVIPTDNVSVLTFDETIIKSLLPIDFEVFGYRFISMFQIMANPHFLEVSWSDFVKWLGNASNILLLLSMPVFMIIFIYYNFAVFKKVTNSTPTQISKPLATFFWFQENIFKHIKSFFKNLWREFCSSKIFVFSFIILALYNINMFSFFLTLLAWYFYFVFSVDLISLWVLVCKFIISISPLLRPVFIPFWVVGIIVLIEWIKISVAFRKLEDFYDKNDNFVSELGIITGIYGPPGTGKNLLEIAIATQKEVLLRKQAFSGMMEIRSEFPDFPFRFLEQDVEKVKRDTVCVNKIQVEYYFRKLFSNQEFIYSYNLKKNKTTHYDKLKVANIKDELLDYAQLYYIYISSLAASTYALRYDVGVKIGHALPEIKYDFFHRDFRNDKDSQISKIFDMNLIRLGEQLDGKSGDVFVPSEDKTATLADFGVLTLSEFGKDRGNRFTNQSRKDNKVKPQNDGTANCLGILRHLVTVRYKQYGFIIWDEQKLSAFSGLEAAMAENNIFLGKQNRKTKLTLPLWFVEGTILEWCQDKFNGAYEKYIYLRNDKTLFSYAVSHLSAFFNNLTRNINNTFGYRKLALSLSGVNVNGAQEKSGEESFFLMNKIVFSNRYRTDCYKGFFDTLKKQAKVGINEMSSFDGVTATIEELIRTNGFFATELSMALIEKVTQNIEVKKKKGVKKEKDMT